MMQLQLKRRMLDLKFLSPGGSLTIDLGTLQTAARQPFGAGHYRFDKTQPLCGPFQEDPEPRPTNVGLPRPNRFTTPSASPSVPS
jgi:hypothetical protein